MRVQPNYSKEEHADLGRKLTSGKFDIRLKQAIMARSLPSTLSWVISRLPQNCWTQRNICKTDIQRLRFGLSESDIAPRIGLVLAASSSVAPLDHGCNRRPHRLIHCLENYCE
jgi:hypothetical protein